MTSAGSPKVGESRAEMYTETAFCDAVWRTYSKGERDLERFSGRVEGIISTLGRPIFISLDQYLIGGESSFKVGF